ncbi:hypothetical protein DES53_108239 [Roseimicrobium gellanilyticum]|uniref:DUF3397 domain-containing protein n=1 Tax=Roseimicrobium gellanilyticum TaxID=748857 RepID=A0A366HDK8_9BACT|nr:hypothetical protein [Roseimicrobium gellanilyticum]RBP40532.1 hypothetical protein DES53_108239 [Roseimicrobium gellanilyticum]
MAPSPTTLAWLILALLVLPACYLALCYRMHRTGITRPPHVPYFFLFGTVGGWLLALALSPSGWTATTIISLITLAPMALLTSAWWLRSRRTLSIYHRAAFYGCVGYPGIVSALLCVGTLLHIFTR